MLLWAGLEADWLLVLGVPGAVGAAVYTAFLFGQAEGRDLWQSGLLPAHMLLQSVMAGAAFGLLLGTEALLPVLGVSAAGHLLMALSGDLWMPHASDTAARAAFEMTRGRYRRSYWGGGIVLGCAVPIAEALIGGAGVVAGAAALIGLFFYERAFVSAPQEIPNS